MRESFEGLLGRMPRPGDQVALAYDEALPALPLGFTWIRVRSVHTLKVGELTVYSVRDINYDR